MDDKQKSMISCLVERINQEIFDEIDVLALLILIRELAQPKGLTNELGHFVAHRQRDRGQFHDYLLSNANKIIDASIEKNVFTALVNENAHTTPESIIQDLNVILSKIKIPSLKVSLSNTIAYCIASLLQKVKFEDKHGQVIGETFIIYTPNGAALVAATSKNIISLFPFIAIWDGPHFEGESYAATPNNYVHVSHNEHGIQINSL